VPHANAEAMNIHLDAISRAVAPGAHALIDYEIIFVVTTHILGQLVQLTF
jgi:hypothetical protein